MEKKRVADSYTEQVQILTQSNMNGMHRLFGGQLMSWIDVVACVVARRHCGMNVTTLKVSDLLFKEPAFANDTVLLCGHITYAGNTSMEISVQTFVENLDGSRREINTAHLTIVAIGEDGRPCKVPGLILETEEEKIEWEAAKKRRELRSFN